MYAKILSHTDMQRARTHARGKRLSGWNYGGCFSPGDAPAFSQHATRNVGHLIFSGDKKPSTLFKNKPGEKRWGRWIPVGAAQPFPKAQPAPVHGTPTVPAASLSAPPMGGGGVEAGAAGIWGCLRRNVPAHKGPIVKASALTAGRQQTSPHSPNTSWCTQGAWGGGAG